MEKINTGDDDDVEKFRLNFSRCGNRGKGSFKDPNYQAVYINGLFWPKSYQGMPVVNFPSFEIFGNYLCWNAHLVSPL